MYGEIAAAKQNIIRVAGTSVSITRVDETVPFTTRVIIGKVGRSSSSDLSIFHSYRRVQALNSDDITVGSIIDLTADIKLLVIAKYTERISDVITTDALQCFIINTAITVVRDSDAVLDPLFPLKTSVIETPVIADLPAFQSKITQDLIDNKVGVIGDSNLVVFCRRIDFETLDRVSLNSTSRDNKLEVVGWDDVTYEGISVIGLRFDLRKYRR